MYTFQSAFDKATAGIIAQGEPSIKMSAANPSCMYRHDGKSCAVGQLLTDEQIERFHVTEGENAAAFPIALIAELLPGEDVFGARGFLNDLQMAHDYAGTDFARGQLPVGTTFLSDFRRRANEVAVTYNLEPIK